MIDERDVRDMLRRRADAINPTPADPPAAVRRARRRLVRTGMAGVLTALVLVSGAVGGLRAIERRQTTVPAEPPPTRNGRIALVYPEGSEATLYTVAADGSDRRALTTIHAEYPDWSPDGSTIAFDDGRNIHGSPLIVPNGHIFTVRADGTGLTQITRGNGGEFSPSWSPDGTHLAITAKEPGLPAGISILDLATGNMEPITTSPYRGYWDAAPDYSPDGQQIAFIRVRQLIEKGSTRDLTALFVVDVDGSDLRRLTPWTMNAGLPSWSPDGSRIAFNSRDHSIAPGSGDAQIFTIRPDGTDLTRLTAETNAASFWPSWSPDGARIVFTRYVFAPESQAFRLYTMKADGSRAAPLTEQTILDVNQADWGQHP